MLTLLTELLADLPELGDWLETAMPAPAASNRLKSPAAKAAAPKRKKQVNTEAYRRRVRGIMRGLDHMRASEAYWHVEGLTEQLRGVEKTAMEFLAAGDAETALQILMTLLEESYDGFEHIDDSDGYQRNHSYHLVAIVADALIAHRPKRVIRASIKQSDALIAKTQSKYYKYAAQWLGHAKAAYAQMGQTADWQKYLSKLKEEYRRRPALIVQLERL